MILFASLAMVYICIVKYVVDLKFTVCSFCTILFPNNLNFLDHSDILSYYKESKAGETGTYILSYAKINNKTEIQALKDFVERAVTIVERIRTLTKGNAREAWDRFMVGYTWFHMMASRYRLREILPEFFD